MNVKQLIEKLSKLPEEVQTSTEVNMRYVLIDSAIHPDEIKFTFNVDQPKVKALGISTETRL